MDLSDLLEEKPILSLYLGVAFLNHLLSFVLVERDGVFIVTGDHRAHVIEPISVSREIFLAPFPREVLGGAGHTFVHDGLLREERAAESGGVRCLR